MIDPPSEGFAPSRPRFAPRATERTTERVSAQGAIAAAPEGFVGHPADELLVRPAPGSGIRRWLSERAAGVAALSDVRFILLVYFGTRALLLVVAFLDSILRHDPFTDELANWDGAWYRSVGNLGYPQHVFHDQTNLGFFPLYPLVARGFSYLFLWSTPYGTIGAITVAAVVISTVGGLITTVLIHRMAREWWDAAAARRAVLLFCLFPGSIVFTMVYAEGLAIPLAVGCIYALSQRRWVLAGVLSALATAVEPEALILVGVCGVSALLELHRRGWTSRAGLKSLWAPILAPLGAIAFGAFLWAWTGSPFASFIAQHDGWGEKTSPLALIHDARLLGGELFGTTDHGHVNLNYVVGLVGALLLVGMLWLLWKQRRRVPIEAIVWTLGISFLTVTSWNVPPNPRLLITAFPLLMVTAYYVRGKRFAILCWANGVLLVVLSALTFVGLTLRP